MASITAGVNFVDGISSVLWNVDTAVNSVVDSFYDVASAADAAFDDRAFDSMEASINNVNDELDAAVQGQNRFNNEIQNGVGQANSLESTIKKVVSAVASLAAVKTAVDWIQDTLDDTNEAIRVATQLQNVLSNVGADKNAFSDLEKVAENIQSIGMYDGDSMLGGAAELSTYLSDTEAIASMMGTLADYAAGMSGGGEIDTTQMVDYATQLGKALNGTYDGLLKKGFELTDQQKEIIENGTDMEKALVLEDVIAESWDGLYEAMSNTPEGRILSLQNAWGDVREEVGYKLYPAVLSLFDTIRNNMPTIEAALNGFATAVQWVIFAIEGVIEAAAAVADFFSENWTIIEPIIMGIAAALAVYYGAQVAANAVTLISKGIHLAMAAAQMMHAAMTGTLTAATAAQIAAQNGLNAAMYASPITWILLIIIAVIAAIYAVVAAINKVTGSTISATGIITGVLAVAAAFIGNLFVALINFAIDIFVVLWNFIAAFANFFANVFTDPVGAIARLFFDLVDTVLSLLQSLASAIDTIFGSNLSGSVQGWRNNLGSWVDSTFGSGTEIMAQMSAEDMHLGRFEYGAAWDAGYAFGEGIEDTVGDMFDIDSAFGDLDLGGGTDYTGNAVAGDISDIASNTGSIADSVSSSNEDLKYLRDAAEAKAIDRYSTVEITVSPTINNTVKNGVDLDGIVNGIMEGLEEAIDKAAEGAHL